MTLTVQRGVHTIRSNQSHTGSATSARPAFSRFAEGVLHAETF